MRHCCVSALAFAFCLWMAPGARAQAHFWRGDANRDGAIDLSDGVGTLNYLFLGAAAPPCLDAADVDDTGELDIADPVNLFGFLFLGGRPPVAPYPRIDADPTDSGEAGNLNCLGPCQDISGDITSNRTLVRTRCYKLIGQVFVKAPATLTIEAGTTILGDTATEGLLVIDRGAKIDAVGTPTLPIVFTSDKPVGQRARGNWGGVVILGRGDLNIPGKEGVAEGFVQEVRYGGKDNVIADDNSGRMSYVRIEFGGTEIAPNNEINGLSLFAVGSGTQLDHINVRFNLDDGIEWFGGSVDLKYGLCHGIRDDNFDYSFGYRGNGQYWLCQQRGDEADMGFEVDNSETSFGDTPLTRPTISNVTLIGDPDTVEGSESVSGILLRRGAGTVLYNAIVQGFKSSGLDIDNGVTTNNNPTNGDLIVNHCIFAENGPSGGRNFTNNETGTNEETAANGFAFTSVEFGRTLNADNVEATASQVVNPYDHTAPNFRPQNDAMTSPFNPATLGSFFEPAAYRGAVPPVGSGDDWTQAPWISYANN